MKAFIVGAAIAASLLLDGCTSTPDSISKDTAQELKQEPLYKLCFAYNVNHDPAVKSEIESRVKITAEQWQAVEEHKVKEKDSECQAAMAWGQPTYIKDESQVFGFFMEKWIYKHPDGKTAYLLLLTQEVVNVQEASYEPFRAY